MRMDKLSISERTGDFSAAQTTEDRTSTRRRRTSRARCAALAGLVGTTVLAPFGLPAAGATVPATAHTATAPDQPGCSATGTGSPTDSVGYWLAGADGSVYSCGDATWSGSLTSQHVTPDDRAVGIASCGSGYWLATSGGAVYSFGAHYYGGANGHADPLGPASGTRLNERMVGTAATPEPLVACLVTRSYCDSGCWLVAADGGVFSYSSASAGAQGYSGSPANFLGSTGCLRLNQPVVGMAASPDTADVGANTACHTGPEPPGGYWMVASDGGVFAFGDAPFLGSTGCMRLNRSIVGMIASPDPTTVGGNTACDPGAAAAGGSAGLPPCGYLLVASDGGVFSFGNVTFAGSLPGSGISVNEIVGIAQ